MPILVNKRNEKDTHAIPYISCYVKAVNVMKTIKICSSSSNRHALMRIHTRDYYHILELEVQRQHL